MQKTSQNEEIKNMSELKKNIYDEKNGLHYTLIEDYYIPDLNLPEEHRPIGKYGRLHREYLREVHPVRLNTLIPVSYTHLDVYKRQRSHTAEARPFFIPVPPRRRPLRKSFCFRATKKGSTAKAVLPRRPASKLRARSPVVLSLIHI